MKKRMLASLLAGAMMLSLAACAPAAPKETTPAAATTPPATTAPVTQGRAPIAAADLKIGMVMIGEENDNGYNYNHAVGMREMQEEFGIKDEQIIYKRNILEDSSCTTAIQECIEAGAQIVFCNSFGHENFMVPLAEENPNIEFCHATGFQAAGTANTNDHNYFTKIFEARYLAGIAAGLKAKEIANPKLGYVGAMPFAEVISGFTAFYLGAKSVYPDVTMKVMYTNSWSDAPKEAQVAQALIDAGCGVISQHSDTTAPATTAQAAGAFQVGYNADMISAAPKASLTSARVDWGVYYKYAVGQMISGEAISTDWCQGLAEDAVYLSPLNDGIVAPGTQEAIDAAKADLISGKIHVFDGPLTGEGKDFSGNPVSIDVKAGDFFDESGKASAPSWNYIIPGIENIVEG